MHPWGVSGSSAMEHDSSACGTQTWTYYALDISLVGRRFSYLFCELLDVQLGQGPDLGTVPGHCLPPTPGTGLSPAEGHHGYPEAVGWKLSLEGPPPGCPQQCERVWCLELRGRAGHVLSVQNPIRCPQSPGAAGRVLSAEWASRPSQGQPFPSVPVGPPGSRRCPLVGCQERAPSLSASRNGRGEGRTRELCVSKLLPLPFLPDPGLARSGPQGERERCCFI